MLPNDTTIPPCCPDEEWRAVPGFIHREVSSCGRVRTWYRAHDKWHNTPVLFKEPRLVSVHPSGKGYLRITLSAITKLRTLAVHTLVLDVFVSPRPKGMWGLHKDDQRTNNHLTNLYWGTPKANSEDRERNGHALKGEDINLHKLAASDVTAIRERYATGENTGQLAKQFAVDRTCIGDIARGETWSHIGGPRTIRGRYKPPKGIRPLFAQKVVQ